MLARATADFIDTVSGRLVDFSFDRVAERAEQVPDADNPGRLKTVVKPVVEKVNVQLPLIAVVPVPNLQIENVDLTFDIEVKSQTAMRSSGDDQTDADRKGDWGSKGDFEIHGVTTAHRENTRSSDRTAKYHLQINAMKQPVPETLARVLDMIAASVAPQPPVRTDEENTEGADELSDLISEMQNRLDQQAGELDAYRRRDEEAAERQCQAPASEDGDIQCRNEAVRDGLCELHLYLRDGEDQGSMTRARRGTRRKT